MRPRLAMLVLLAIGCAIGCSSSSPPASSAPPPTSPPPSAPPDAAPPPAADRCATIATQFKATLTAGKGTCAAASDCGCYNPVAAGLGCGGVTDAATSAALRAIEADFHAAKCAWPLQCAAWACQPRCDAGRCVR